MSDSITRLNTALSGCYHIESEFGEGGMATVYLADDIKHERKVALKLLKPELAGAPLWASNGSAIYFQSGTTVMRASAAADGSFSRPEELFDRPDLVLPATPVSASGLGTSIRPARTS